MLRAAVRARDFDMFFECVLLDVDDDDDGPKLAASVSIFHLHPLCYVLLVLLHE